MPLVLSDQEQARADSAKKLGMTKFLPTIDSIPVPENQASDTNQGVVGDSPAPSYTVPNVSGAPAGKSQSWLDSIPDAVGGDSRGLSGDKSWLDKIPDAKNEVQQSFENVATTDADRNAKVLKLSQQSGQPPEFIDANLKQAEAANTVSPELFDRMERDYPGSMEFYKKRENMAVAHDDVPNMVAHEDHMQKADDAHSLLSAFEGGFGGSVPGLTFKGGKPSDYSLPADASIPLSLAHQAGALIGDLPFMAIGGVLGTAVGGLTAPVTGPVGAIAGAGAGAFGLPAYLKAAIADQYKNGDSKELRDSFDRSYEIAKETGKQATVGALTTVAGASVGAGTVTALGAEVLAMTMAGAAVEDQPITGRSLLEGGLMVGGMHLVGVGAGKALTPGESKIESSFREAVQQERAFQTENLLENTINTAAESKVRKRLPDMWREQVSSLANKAGFPDVFIDTDKFQTFFQDGKEAPEDVAKSMNADYEEAQKTGTIRIPFVDFVDKLVDKVQYRELLKDAKLDPDHLSPNELEAVKAEQKAGIDAQVKAAGEPAAAEQPTTDAVFNDVQAQLLKAGQGTQEAETNAKLFSEANKRRAERLGVDPHELYKKENLSVVSGGQAPADALNQSVSPLGFYSQVESEVSKMEFKSMPAKDLANRIGNIQGLKKEELESLGIKEWLAAQDGKVSKEDVLNFIKQNGVQVEQVVKSADFSPGGESGGADWADQYRDDSGNSDDVYSEVENYTSDKDYMQEQRLLLREQLTSEHTNPDGTVNENELHDDIEKTLADNIEKQAVDYVESDDYFGARFVVEEKNSGWSLIGNDESGWYSPETGDEYGYNLEEAKIKLTAEAIAKGKIEGDLKSISKEEDIKWKEPNGNLPSRATLNKKQKALFAKDKERLIKKELEKYPGSYDDKDEAPADRQKRLEEAANDLAYQEVRDAYSDTKNKRNTVTIRLDHPIVDGKIEGNDVKGYSFKFTGEKESQAIKLEAKTAEEAKAESVKVMVDKGRLTPKKAEGDKTEDVNAPTGDAKWNKYVVPGGENYREVLLTLPKVGPDKFQYKTHFDEKNIVAHVRLTDRTDDAGRKTLFIEELQSDWHQQGRERGYKTGAKFDEEANQAARTELADKFNAIVEPLGIKTKVSDALDNSDEYAKLPQEAKKLAGEYSDLWKAERENASNVPDAPFKNTEAWAGLALKRIIRMAAEQGYEAVAWTPGEVHVDRWGTDSVSWAKAKPDRFEVTHDAQDKRYYAIKKDQTHGRPHSVDMISRYDGKAGAYETAEQAQAAAQADVDKLNQPHWLVGSVEQNGGVADGVDIEEMARARGKLLERKGERVTTKEELKAVIADTLNRERSDRSLESLTESVWKQMQSEDSGVKAPRKEGMEFFYDNLLPKKVAPAVLKGLDKSAKVEVGKISTGELRKISDSIDKIRYPEGKKDVWEIPITPAMKEKALAGQTLFQPGGDSPRGAISFGDNATIIHLLGAADKSTFAHETFHYFVKTFGEDVAYLKGLESADPSKLTLGQKTYISDGKKLLDFVGADSFESLTKEQHETLARAGEQYLREGKAPSEELQGVFKRFRKWLEEIYKQATDLKVEINPELRGVFDRLFASEKEIERAQKFSGLEFADIKDVPESVQGKLRDLQERARETAINTLVKEQMPELEKAAQDRKNEIRDRLTKAAESDVSKLPVHQAIENFKSEGVSNPYALAEKGLAGKLNRAESVQFEVMTEVHGFSSAEDLAHAIIEAKDGFRKEVNARVSEAMKEFADLRDTQRFKDMAIEAIHNKHTAELLALEKEVLSGLIHKAEIGAEATRRNRADAKANAEAAKEYARSALAAKSIKESGNARIYITAERNAAVKSAKAAAKGDYEAAAKAKGEQLQNHALAAEAMRNRAEIARTLKSSKKYAKRGGDMMGMAYGSVRQIDGLLSRYGLANPNPEDMATLAKTAADMLAKGEDPAEIANRTGLKPDGSPETLPDFVQRMNDGYFAMSLPEGIMAAGDKSYKDLTLKELRDMHDAVAMIAAVGKTLESGIGLFDKLDWKDRAKLFRASVEANFGSKHAQSFLPGSGDNGAVAKLLSNLSEFPDAVTRTLDTMLTVCQKLDGYETKAGRLIPKEGPAKKYIYRPFAEAESNETVRLEQATKELEAIYAKNYDIKEFSKYKDTRIKIDGIKTKDDAGFTKEEILCMALNWGNAGNRDRIQRGFGFDDATMQKLFSHLDKNDWQFAQDVWDHIDKYWPEISKLEMDVNGSQPGKVQALPFENEHGKWRGGYYPLAYDFTKSAEAFKNILDKDANFKQYSTAKAATDQGHTEARVASLGRMVKLSLDVISNHHEDVIHDLEFRRAVINANRFLMQADTKTALVNALGIKGYAAIGDWLKSVAGGTSEPMGALDHIARAARYKVTFVNLAFRVATAPKIAAENIINTSSEIGMSGTIRALTNYWLNSSKMHDMIVGKSTFMKKRADGHLDRDMGDVTDAYRGKGGIINDLRGYAFFVHAFLDRSISNPLWSYVYRNAISEHGDEKLAVHQADESVKRTFMSGGNADQASFARGSEAKKSMTTAYGYQSMMFNRFSAQTHQANMEWINGNHLAAAAVMARATIYTFAMPAITAALTAEFMRNTNNVNQEERRKRMTAKVIEEMSPLKFIPIARDMQGYFIRKAVGEHAGSLHFTPLEEAAMTIADAGAEAVSGHHSQKFGEHSAAAAGLLLGVPNQLNTVTFNFLDWQKQNANKTWRDAFSRKAKK